MDNKNGFTLLEVLFVLAIWSILIILSAPLHLSVFNDQTEETFLETLEMDMLYMQSLSYASRDYYRLSFQGSQSYSIKNAHTNKLYVEREIPDGWEIEKDASFIISFKKDGLIAHPGSFIIQTLQNRYKMICPFGKGRCYFDKQ